MPRFGIDTQRGDPGRRVCCAECMGTYTVQSRWVSHVRSGTAVFRTTIPVVSGYAVAVLASAQRRQTP